MTIVRRDPPPGARDVIRDVINGSLADLAGARGSVLEADLPEEMSEPLPLYSVDPGRLKPGPAGPAMVQTGWRSVLTSYANMRIADVKEKGGDFRFIQLVGGARVARMIEAAEMAENYFDFGRDLELRVFESSQLKVGALWLRGEQSFFIPFAGLDMRIMDEADFVHTLIALVPVQKHPLLARFTAIAAVGSTAIAAIAALRRRRKVRASSDDDDDGAAIIG